MSRLLLIVAIFTSLSFIQATPDKGSEHGIQFFEGTWEEALATAQEEDKIVFLDAYASWCGPCKLLKRNVFTDQEVGAFFNQEFINFEMDMERGEGPQVARQYRVSAYPTLIFVKPDGSVVHKAVGYHPQKQLIELGKKALSNKAG